MNNELLKRLYNLPIGQKLFTPKLGYDVPLTGIALIAKSLMNDVEFEQFKRECDAVQGWVQEGAGMAVERANK